MGISTKVDSGQCLNAFYFYQVRQLHVRLRRVQREDDLQRPPPPRPADLRLGVRRDFGRGTAGPGAVEARHLPDVHSRGDRVGQQGRRPLRGLHQVHRRALRPPSQGNEVAKVTGIG